MVRSRCGCRGRSANDFRSDTGRPDGWTRADHAGEPPTLRPARVALERQSARNVLIHEFEHEMRGRFAVHCDDRDAPLGKSTNKGVRCRVVGAGLPKKQKLQMKTTCQEQSADRLLAAGAKHNSYCANCCELPRRGVF